MFLNFSLELNHCLWWTKKLSEATKWRNTSDTSSAEFKITWMFRQMHWHEMSPAGFENNTNRVHRDEWRDSGRLSCRGHPLPSGITPSTDHITLYHHSHLTTLEGGAWIRLCEKGSNCSAFANSAWERWDCTCQKTTLFALCRPETY